jgi:hypothetical protein
MSLLFLKLLHPSLVVEAAGAVEEVEVVAAVVGVDEDEVVVVDAVLQHSAAVTLPEVVLLPLQRAVAELEAEAAVVVEQPETLHLLSFVPSTIGKQTSKANTMHSSSSSELRSSHCPRRV